MSRASAAPNVPTATGPTLTASSAWCALRPGLKRGVTDKLDIGDATRPVEVHAITGGNHTEDFVMVFLPRERLLIQADASRRRRRTRRHRRRPTRTT